MDPWPEQDIHCLHSDSRGFLLRQHPFVVRLHPVLRVSRETSAAPATRPSTPTCLTLTLRIATPLAGASMVPVATLRRMRTLTSPAPRLRRPLPIPWCQLARTGGTTTQMAKKSATCAHGCLARQIGIAAWQIRCGTDTSRICDWNTTTTPAPASRLDRSYEGHLSTASPRLIAWAGLFVTTYCIFA